MQLEREIVENEKSFEFLGFVVLDNHLKPVTREVIDELNQCKCRSIIASGDSILTAINVAKKCNILSISDQVCYSEDIEYNQNYDQEIEWKMECEEWMNEHQKKDEEEEIADSDLLFSDGQSGLEKVEKIVLGTRTNAETDEISVHATQSDEEQALL